MSYKAAEWAWAIPLTPTEKLILLALSDHADDAGKCWPSLAHLERKTGCHRTTVWRTIDRLVQAGLVERIESQQFASTQYQLKVGAQSTYQVQATPRCTEHLLGAQDTSGRCAVHLEIGAERTPNQSIESVKNPIQEQKKKRPNKYSDDDHSLANWIFSKIREMNPEHKQPNFETWANDIRLMREKDRKSHQQIQELFAWANTHSFWNDKILSPNKLREKWDQLTIQRKKTKDSGAADAYAAGAI